MISMLKHEKNFIIRSQGFDFHHNHIEIFLSLQKLKFQDMKIFYHLRANSNIANKKTIEVTWRSRHFHLENALALSSKKLPYIIDQSVNKLYHYHQRNAYYVVFCGLWQIYAPSYHTLSFTPSKVFYNLFLRHHSRTPNETEKNHP